MLEELSCSRDTALAGAMQYKHLGDSMHVCGACWKALSSCVWQGQYLWQCLNMWLQFEVLLLSRLRKHCGVCSWEPAGDWGRESYDEPGLAQPSEQHADRSGPLPPPGFWTILRPGSYEHQSQQQLFSVVSDCSIKSDITPRAMTVCTGNTPDAGDQFREFCN